MGPLMAASPNAINTDVIEVKGNGSVKRFPFRYDPAIKTIGIPANRNAYQDKEQRHNRILERKGFRLLNPLIEIITAKAAIAGAYTARKTKGAGLIHESNRLD